MDEIKIRKQIHQQLCEELELAQTELQRASQDRPETVEERNARCLAISRDLDVNERAILRMIRA